VQPLSEAYKEVHMIRMTDRKVRTASASVVAALLALPTFALAAPIQDYIAVGDSVAFGETDFTHNPSFGDRGYVKPYADFLGTQNGGVRPKVINLGVDAETTSTFFNGGPQGDGTVSGQPAPQLNLNYPHPAPTQNSLLLSTIATETAAGHNIGTVSVELGANDLLAAVNQPNFFTLSAAQQQAKVGQALAGVQANYANLLAELKAELPNANVLVMGYHNPFNAFPNTPIGKIADPAIQALNKLLAGEAAAFGDRYVDGYTPFLGHELSLTLIAQGNVHPNAAGYAVIAAQMERASVTVPEPSSLIVLGFGVIVLASFHRRGRRAPNPMPLD
jgi:lysophospholipase L1-like esterase